MVGKIIKTSYFNENKKTHLRVAITDKNNPFSKITAEREALIKAAFTKRLRRPSFPLLEAQSAHRIALIDIL